MTQHIYEMVNTKFNIIEKLKEGDKYNKFIVEALILPWEKVSRNGNKYVRSSFTERLAEWEGIPVMYNHIVEGADLPYGKILNVWDSDEGLMAKLDLDPEETKFINKIEKGYLNKVSVHILPEKVIERNGVNEVYYKSPVELSFVPSPGFMETKMQFFAESLKNDPEKLNKFIELLKGDTMSEEKKTVAPEAKESIDFKEDLNTFKEAFTEFQKKADDKMDNFSKAFLEALDSIDDLANEQSELSGATGDVMDILYQLLDKITGIEQRLISLEKPEGDIEDTEPVLDPEPEGEEKKTEEETAVTKEDEEKKKAEEAEEKIKKEKDLYESYKKVKNISFKTIM